MYTAIIKNPPKPSNNTILRNGVSIKGVSIFQAETILSEFNKTVIIGCQANYFVVLSDLYDVRDSKCYKLYHEHLHFFVLLSFYLFVPEVDQS